MKTIGTCFKTMALKSHFPVLHAIWRLGGRVALAQSPETSVAIELRQPADGLKIQPYVEFFVALGRGLEGASETQR